MTAYGIDLGTTNSCIARIDEHGRPVVLRNTLGERLIPSVVYFKDRDQAVVGSLARNAALAAPELVVRQVKRSMGDSSKTYSFHGRNQSPATVSAMILRNLVDMAALDGGEPVRDVVITVPAYFGVAEKEATRQAGEIAGLVVLDVIPEPLAAALSHVAAHSGEGLRHLLVYDLGGGTFDTSVIRVDGPQVDVLSTGGDLRLGGAEWDERITDYLLDSFVREHPHLDPAADPGFMQDLADRAEQLKRDLSAVEARQHQVRFKGETTRIQVTREYVEKLTNDLVARTMKITEETLDLAPGVGPEQIDEVVLVGGMTHTPVIAERLRERFGARVRLHDPEYAVARGAALFARICTAGPAADVADLLGTTVEQVELMRARRPTGVLPRAVGLKIADQDDPRVHTDPANVRLSVMHLLHANTRLPADTGDVSVATFIDNQPMVEVEVWEAKPGEPSAELADNERIARGMLRLPPRTPARTPFHVRFEISQTGLLAVTACDPRTGEKLRVDTRIGLDSAQMTEATETVAGTEVTS